MFYPQEYFRSLWVNGNPGQQGSIAHIDEQKDIGAAPGRTFGSSRQDCLIITLRGRAHRDFQLHLRWLALPGGQVDQPSEAW